MGTKHVTLAANTPTPVDAGAYADSAGVFNRDAAVEVWATVNGADPIVDGDNSYLVPPGTRRILSLPTKVNAVRLLSTGTPKVEVEFS